MSFTCKSIFLVIAAVGIFGLSRMGQSGGNYDVDKTSPNGIYRVKVELREEKGKGTRDYTERLKVVFFKGQEIIHAYESENSDQYEPSIRDRMQVVEWVNDNVLHMGEDRSDQPFYDELIVSNNTDESLKYVSVGYGKFESFRAFDLAPGSQVTLWASPRFISYRSSNYFLGYGGMTQSGKKFQGSMEGKQRKSPADGPLKFQITINPKDLK